MAELIERRLVEVTPELARHYLKYNNYPLQRNLKPFHVEMLADKMKDGRFRFGEIAIVSMNGKQYMMNGQHVCNAVIESGVDVPCMLEKFKCKNDIDTSELFRQFELEPRSIAEMVKVEAYSLGIKWPTWVSSLAVAGATIERSGSSNLFTSGKGRNNKRRLTKEEKVLLLREYMGEGRFLNEIMTNINGGQRKGASAHIRHIRRAPLAYMMFKTFRINQRLSREFWIRVRDGEHLTKEMPEYKLRNFLIGAVSSTAPVKYIGPRITNHEYAYRTALAWNAYITGTPTRLSYSRTKPVPALKKPGYKLKKKENKDG